MHAKPKFTCLATTPPTCGNNCFQNVNKSIPVYVPEDKEADCAVTIAPLGTDSFSIRLAGDTTYLDLKKAKTVTTSKTPVQFAITDGGKLTAKISKTLPSDGKDYVLKYNTTGGEYFRMYSNDMYTLPSIYRKKDVVTNIDSIESSALRGEDSGKLVLRNGQIFILRGDKVYTVTGQEVK